MPLPSAGLLLASAFLCFHLAAVQLKHHLQLYGAAKLQEFQSLYRNLVDNVERFHHRCQEGRAAQVRAITSLCWA